MEKRYKTGIGQDSHRFLSEDASKPCIIAGIIFQDTPGFQANSDGDVVFHALCNACTSISGVKILGGVADELCLKDGITDSRVYLQKAKETLGDQEIVHVAISIEGKRPKFGDMIDEIRRSIADVLGIQFEQVGATATTGEGLTDFGCGDGLQCLAIITVCEKVG